MTNLKEEKISLKPRSEQSETKLNQAMNHGEKKLELVKILEKLIKTKVFRWGLNKQEEVGPEAGRR